MITKNIPAKVWMLIAGDDMQLWNALVRAVPGLHTQELLEQMMTKYAARMLDTRWGMIFKMEPNHTFLDAGVYHHDLLSDIKNQPATSSKLLSNTENQPAADISKFSKKLRIYAIDGIPTRTDGPAIMLYSRRRSTAIDVYYQTGSIERIEILEFKNNDKATLTKVLIGKKTRNRVVRHYKGEHAWKVHDAYPQSDIKTILKTSAENGGFVTTRDESGLVSAELAVSRLLANPYARSLIGGVVCDISFLAIGR